MKPGDVVQYFDGASTRNALVLYVGEPILSQNRNYHQLTLLMVSTDPLPSASCRSLAFDCVPHDQLGHCSPNIVMLRDVPPSEHEKPGYVP